MNFEILPILAYALITTFTPGPNNISSASVGLVYGYRRTLPYLLGIFSGFFTIMIICAFISVTLLQIIPGIEKILALVGAAYILWLAYHTFKANYNYEEKDMVAFGFMKGYLLQFFESKGDYLRNYPLFNIFKRSATRFRLSPVYCFCLCFNQLFFHINLDSFRHSNPQVNEK